MVVSFDLLSDLDWIAVLVGAIAYFVIGAAWYAPPVFGKAWMAAGGMEMPADGQRPGPVIYAVPLLGALASAIAIGMIAFATSTDTLGEGVVLGVVVGIGFAVSVAMVTATFESSKPSATKWGTINAGYHLVGNLVAAIIIASMA